MTQKTIAYFENKEGGLVVEAALILPFLVTLVLGGLDISNLLLQNHKLESRLVMATTYLSKSDDPRGKEVQAKRLALTGNLDGIGEPLFPNWTAADISINYMTTSNQSGEYRGDSAVTTIQVSSEISLQGFGIISSIFPEGATISAKSEDRLVGGGL